RMVIDEARQWASEHGCHVFHLGGGVGSGPDDSLLRFKMGFSGRTHPFCVWRWVLFPEVYQQLCDHKAALNERLGRRSKAGYFPEYRSPTVAIDATATPQEVLA